MKKLLLIPSGIMFVFLAFCIVNSFADFGFTLPIAESMKGIFWGVYCDLALLMFVIAIAKPGEFTTYRIICLILEFIAIFFIIMSMMRLESEGSSNWYLPFGLGFNAIALLINAHYKKKEEKGYR